MADYSIDFSPIANLGKTYRDARIQRAREMTLADLGRGASAQDVATRLFQVGDVQGGLSLANLANTVEQQKFNRGIAERQIALQEANARKEPANVQAVRAAGLSPASPEGRKALFPRTDTPLSATDKRAIFAAEDAIPAIKGTIENLDRALELNDKTFSGAGADARAWLGSALPDAMVPDVIADKATADRTTEWQKIMGPEALQAMANTLKGATTDFELRKFTEMLADPATPPKVRKSVIERMKRLAGRQLELHQGRVNDLRGQTYFKPGGEQKAQGVTRQEYDALPSGATYTAPDGSVRTKR